MTKRRLTLKRMHQLNKAEIDGVGPRYFPGFKADSPNLDIKELSIEFQVLGQFDDWCIELDSLAGELRNSFRDFNNPLVSLSEGDLLLAKQVSRIIRTLPSSTVKRRARDINILTKSIKKLEKRISIFEQRLEQLSIPPNRPSATEKKELDRAKNSLRTLSGSVYRLSEYLQFGSGCLLGSMQMILLEGDWGTGKTHFLCDLALHLEALRLPAIFVTASAIDATFNPLDSLIESLGLNCSATEFLSELDGLGSKANSRALILIDAINESDLSTWLPWIKSTAPFLNRFPNVGIVVSCRTLVEGISLPPKLDKYIRRVQHPGFDGYEFEAQLAYFDFYNIDSRGIPLLTPEFSNPLVLRMICESVSRFTSGKRRRKFEEITSGQKGMTYILEQFAKDLGKDIESDLGLPRLFCWKLMKGSSRPDLDIGLSGRMGEEERIWLTKEEVFDVMSKSLGFVSGVESELLGRLVSAGLLVSFSRYLYPEDKYIRVYSFAYQRFGDHLIARYLMSKYLDFNSDLGARNSLKRGSKIGKLFTETSNYQGFQYGNLASAIMTEFPERASRHLSRSEVISYLNTGQWKPGLVKGVFLESLVWRTIDQTNFSAETFYYLDYYMKSSRDQDRNDAFESLMTLGIRRNSDLITSHLFDHLSSLSMVDRDVYWSEFLRRCSLGSSIYRLISWIERGFPRIISTDLEQTHVRLLSLALTSTTLNIRDRSTRALVYIGILNPKLLIEGFSGTLKLDDIYVLERYLAALYGVYLNCWAHNSNPELTTALIELAKLLMRLVQDDKSRISSTHSLLNDYIYGILEYATKIDATRFDAGELLLIHDLSHGSGRRKPSTRGIRNVSSEELSSKFFGDFFNYTVGRLVPKRGNYNFEDPKYKKYIDFIAKRMLKMGYKRDTFMELDSNISHSSYREKYLGKVESYQKKYARIAYFELSGWLRSNYKATPHLPWERDIESDVDPSFPLAALRWRLPFNVRRSDQDLSAKSWLISGMTPNLPRLYRQLIESDGKEAEWIMLNAYIDRFLPERKELKTDVRSLICRKSGFENEEIKPEILKYLRSRDSRVHGTPSHLFAGEIPNSIGFSFSGLDIYDDYSFRPPKIEIENTLDQPQLGVYHSCVQWSSASGRSVTFIAGSVITVSPRFASQIDLHNHKLTFDLFNSEDARVSMYREEGGSESYFPGHTLFMRKDVLDKYLTDHDMVLLFAIEGERSFKISDTEYELRGEYIRALQSTRANEFLLTYVYSPGATRLVSC